MEIIISQNQNTSSVTVMLLRGEMYGSNYKNFVTEAQKLYDGGTRNILLDMGNLIFISNAGLTVWHLIARVFRGEDRSSIDDGWGALHVMGNDRDSGFQKHIKLLNPNNDIQNLLNLVGLKAFFEIYTDLRPAMASFQ